MSDLATNDLDLSEDERAILSYFEAHPGQDWVEAAEGLQMNSEFVLSIATYLSLNFLLDIRNNGGLLRFYPHGLEGNHE